MAVGTDQSLSFNAPKYPLDKIYFEPPNGSISVPKSGAPAAPTVYSTSLINDKSELFFCEMQVSIDDLTWYDSGLEPYYVVGGISTFKRFSGWYDMTSSAITLSFYANDAPYTLYYRLVGFSKV